MPTTTGSSSARDSNDATANTDGAFTLGLVAAPDFPQQIAEQLRDELPAALAQRFSERVRWNVATVADPRVGDATGGVQMIDVTREVMREHGWQLSVCLTDLPIRIDGRPVIADASATHGVGLICLPALGARRVPERAREAITRLVDGLVAQSLKPGQRDDPAQRARVERRLDDLADMGAGRAVRWTAGRLGGHLRLLVGMVRANRPWRLIVNLSRALTAALSTVAVVTINAQIWQLGDSLGSARLLTITAASIATLVAAMIVAHQLWERPTDPSQRDRTLLFNTVTLMTLILGVLSLYAAMFVVTLTAAGLIIDSDLLAKELGHPIGLGDYLVLAWMASSLATVGGALGSGVESDESVRAAAYGYRPNQHRAGDSNAENSDDDNN